MAKQRKYYSSEEKVSIRRRRLLEGVAVSTLCNELSLQPTVLWRRLGLEARRAKSPTGGPDGRACGSEGTRGRGPPFPAEPRHSLNRDLHFGACHPCRRQLNCGCSGRRSIRHPEVDLISVRQRRPTHRFDNRRRLSTYGHLR